MKKETEKRAAIAVTLLRKSLTQNLNDVKDVLDQFEEAHDVCERELSIHYGLLVSTQFGLEEIIEKIDNAVLK